MSYQKANKTKTTRSAAAPVPAPLTVLVLPLLRSTVKYRGTRVFVPAGSTASAPQSGSHPPGSRLVNPSYLLNLVSLNYLVNPIQQSWNHGLGMFAICKALISHPVSLGLLTRKNWHMRCLRGTILFFTDGHLE
jgi:hypothetical protein